MQLSLEGKPGEGSAAFLFRILRNRVSPESCESSIGMIAAILPPKRIRWIQGE